MGRVFEGGVDIEARNGICLLPAEGTLIAGVAAT